MQGFPGYSGNPFAGLAQAQVSNKLPWLNIGQFDLEILRCQYTNTPTKGLCFIAEFLIVGSNNPESAPGTQASWVQKMQNPALAFGALKGFIYGAMGVNAKDPQQTSQVDGVIEQVAGAMVGPSNPFQGLMVACHTWATPTKPKFANGPPGVFTKHDYTPFDYAAAGAQAPGLQAIYGRFQGQNVTFPKIPVRALPVGMVAPAQPQPQAPPQQNGGFPGMPPPQPQGFGPPQQSPFNFGPPVQPQGFPSQPFQAQTPPPGFPPFPPNPQNGPQVQAGGWPGVPLGQAPPQAVQPPPTQLPVYAPPGWKMVNGSWVQG